VIARFFKEIGRADELGSGVRNLFKYCRHYSGGKIHELIEEDIFKCIVPLTPEATEQVTEQVEKNGKILEFCKTPKSASEIMDFLGLKHREHFRAKIIQPLLKQGLLKPTIPDKPTSSKQKYYSTKEKKKK
jgi:ATP-dependent DNA helicase RecG